MKILPAVRRQFTVGAEVHTKGGVHFRVWAPKRQRVELLLADQPDQLADAARFELQAEEDGHFAAFVESARAGQLYAFSLDDDERALPDPATRFQPSGPSGWSQIVDPRRYEWRDHDWPGLSETGQVLYEMHIGTFTPEGTWLAAIKQLPELKAAGFTILEVMPVSDFLGEFGWGYDGVCMYAPTRLYGSPDDMRRFVDEAHAVGLGVILDVVYNHFGAIGNYLGEFSDDYHTQRYANEWSSAINFDDHRSQPVRDFFIDNARYWIEEFHLDGYRFDATQSIHDASPTHVIGEITQAARKAAGKKSIYLAAENEPQDVRTVRPVKSKGNEPGGHGMDAAWNDDFHHSSRVRLTSFAEAYYSDFHGTAAELLAAVKRGFIYQGQWSFHQKKPRGTPTTGLPANKFITFLQNHDQVANSATGARIHQLAQPGCLRAMTALWLLAPQTPLFFQGQEFAASSPFLYFADFAGNDGIAVAAGRAGFFEQFPSLNSPSARAQFANPTDRHTFQRCKLKFAEREVNRATYDLHKDLLKLRRDDPIFSRQDAGLIEGTALAAEVLLLRYHADGDAEQDVGDRLLCVNFGPEHVICPLPEPLLAPPASRHWQTLWHSEDFAYGGQGIAPLFQEHTWTLPGAAAVVLQALRTPDSQP